jgi:Putative adhesin
MRLSPWGRVVAISALLVVGGAVALAVGAVASTEPREFIYPVRGAVEGLNFDVGEGDVVIVGGGSGVQVRRLERFSFGHEPVIEPEVDGTVFREHARCPTTLIGPCSVSYRVVVPDNVALDISTTSGNVSLRGYRGSARINTGDGEIDIAGYCGNSLDARAGDGDIALEAACAPPRLSLRSGSGSIHAVLPSGRYDLDAESTSGRESVRGLTPRADAPYAVQVLSASGDVSVEGRS